MEKEMSKLKIYIIGIILGFLPQIANLVVTEFISQIITFDDGIVGKRIKIIFILFCIWGIIFILLLILSFINKYLFLGICTSVIVVLLTIYSLENLYNN